MKLNFTFLWLVLLAIVSTCAQAQTEPPGVAPPPVMPSLKVPKPRFSNVAATGANRQSAPLATTIHYVKAGSAGTGSSWNDASGDLQAMINASASGDQVWITGGTYKPSNIGQSDPRDATFSLKNGVSVLGGFTGVAGTEGNSNARTAIPSSTTLSGDIGNAGTGDNCYHVIFNNANGLDNSAVLDGVVITGGNTDLTNGANLNNFGGGILNYSSSPSIYNCLFVQNSAYQAAGMANIYTTGSNVINCRFINNTAQFIGGLYEASSVNSTITNCHFGQNSVTGSMGGFYKDANTVTLTNCTFNDNTAAFGGALGAGGNTTINVVNCLFWNNGGQNSIGTYGAATVNVSYCLLEAGETDFANQGNNQTIIRTPFANGTSPQLLPCAPAVDAGNNAANSTDIDVLSNNRKVRTIDIGATEFGGTPYSVSVTALATPNPVFVGSPISLQATPSGSPNEPYTYNWTAPSGGILSSVSQNPTSATATASGVSSFSIQVTDAVGCVATASVSVAVKAHSDLTTILHAQPSTVNGTATITLVADVFELNASPTNGTISVYITKDPLLNLTFNGAATIVGGRLVQNSVWSFDGISDSSFYLLTTNQSAGAGSKLSVGLSGQLVPGNTKGNLSISGLIVGSAVGEVNVGNNADAETIGYFSK
jgi:hypothetical protein